MSELNKKLKDDEDISSEDYADLLDKYQFNANELTPGTLVKGTVIKLTSGHVLVDIGSKSEGIIPNEDFLDPQELKSLKSGDEVEAILEKSHPKEGYLILSKRRANAIKALDNLDMAFQHNNWIIGKIVDKVKNGYTVNVGINTFLPESHADVKMIKDPTQLVGKRFKFKVLKFDRRTENAVVSRKLLLQDEKEKRKKQVFAQLDKGKTFKGKVKSLTNFGAFIDLGGIEGLLHISDMSWGKIHHPSELLQNGQEVEVMVLDFDEKEEKISLGYKQLTPDPWENLDIRYNVGQKIIGKIVSLTDFGAFVEIEEGVEGLVHISDLSWSRKMVHPKKLLSVGEEVTVTILDLNPGTKRISLGLKQASPHPLEIIREKFSPGSRVTGKITSVTDFGAFIEVAKDVEGLIHISDMSWKKIKHPSDVVKVGDEIEAVILNIDINKQKFSLGIKQLDGDIWEDFFVRTKTGDLVTVKIVRLASFGVFVEILPGIEGVVFLSELDEKKIDNPAEFFSIGEERSAKIIRLNQSDKKISLSFKQAQLDMQKREYQKYMQDQDDRITLGDLMKDQLKIIEVPKKKPQKKEKEKEKKDDKS